MNAKLRLPTPLSCCALLAAVIGLTGCGGAADQGQVPSSGSDSAAQSHEHADHDHAAHDDAAHDHAAHDHADHDRAGSDHSEPAGTDAGAGGDADADAGADAAADEKTAAALAALSSEDRALAERQKTCPVAGGPLGAMGTPVKVHVQGKDVFVCCQGCEEVLLSNPDKYLAKLKQ
jgi:hypothetical protein